MLLEVGVDISADLYTRMYHINDIMNSKWNPICRVSIFKCQV